MADLKTDFAFLTARYGFTLRDGEAHLGRCSFLAKHLEIQAGYLDHYFNYFCDLWRPDKPEVIVDVFSVIQASAPHEMNKILRSRKGLSSREVSAWTTIMLQKHAEDILRGNLSRWETIVTVHGQSMKRRSKGFWWIVSGMHPGEQTLMTISH